jgi:DNA polymerase-3 subunit epsilon
MKKQIRTFKGKSLLDLPDNYTVIDIETTGLSFTWDKIIEIGAIKVKNNEIVDTFESFVNPSDSSEPFYLDSFITELTGITNDMLLDAPSPSQAIIAFINFIDKDILVGHNINFDINFLYDLSLSTISKPISNNYIDTLRLSRKAFPNYINHKLKTLTENMNISCEGAHRALTDARITNSCFSYIKNHVLSNNIDFTLWKNHASHLNLKTISATCSDFDTEHIFYNQNCVFTGTLSISRKEAGQKLVNVGGILQNSLNKKTNFLIVGNFDYTSSVKNNKSSKILKAESYISKGLDIKIIDENTFFDLL